MELAICELYNENIHGFNESSTKCIHGHYMIIGDVRNIINTWGFMVDLYDSEDEDDIEILSNMNLLCAESMQILNEFRVKYRRNIIRCLNNQPKYKNHKIIRNYEKIIKSSKTFRPEIVKYEILEGQEKIGILKTFWIRIIQRAWKNRFRKNKIAIQHCMNPKHLFLREMRGRFPNECNVKGIRGLLVQ